VLLTKSGGKEKPLHVAAEEPAPSPPPGRPERKPPAEPPAAIMVSAPPRKFPWVLLVLIVGFGTLLVAAGGLWWRWSQPVVVTKEVPVSPPPQAEPALKLSANDYYNLGNEAKDPEEKIKYYT